ncbi:MAG TPA: methionyl-tRNA formyltransferase [Candidatus Acidoferrum sp.]|nr:methionyl-tRNA formyltransferase [Candidatus Acidoferrum sp.]
MRLLFCGTPSFAVPTLKHLLAQSDFQIAAVITQPDRPRGRGHDLSFSPVKEVALAANIPVFQPEKIRTLESEHFLREADPDAIVIIAYGQIIPERLLNIPRLGWINLHASLLPKYRGAAPIQWAIANGESATGITTMRIDAGMDTGDILLQRETPIGPTETTPQLAERLSELGAPLMAETLRGLRDNTLKLEPQDHSAATVAPLLKKESGQINWQQPAQVIYNRMRGFTAWPGAYTHFRATTCHLLGQPASDSFSAGAPGQILYDGKELLVACGQQSFLYVSHVKPEGRKQVSAVDFANGVHLRSGEYFGDA